MRSVRRLVRWLASSLMAKRANDKILKFRDAVRDDLVHQPYPRSYLISARWQEIIDLAMRTIAPMNGQQIAMYGMTQFDVGPVPAQINYLRSARSKYLVMHPELGSVGESNLMPEAAVADCGTVLFSHSLEQAFSYYHNLVEGIGAAVVPHVVEIGSGYGRLIRVLQMAGRAKRFTLVDLPQSLIFAFAFLQLNFPNAAMKVIKSRQDIYPLMELDHDFVFCPVQFADDLKPASVDLLINTYSLGEMPQGSVDHLMRVIHTILKPTHFFSLNSMFTNKNLHFDIGYLGEGNEVVLNLSPEWWPITFEITNSVDAGSWRSTVSTVLKRVDTTRERLIADLVAAASTLENTTDRWLGYMYFAALWSADRVIVGRFLNALRARQHLDRFDSTPAYSFDAIGEVAFLRRLTPGPPLTGGA